MLRPSLTVKYLWRASIGFGVVLAVAVSLLGQEAISATLRIAYAGPLETLDPIRANAMWTQAQAGPLFDQLYGYDYLARPPRLVPLAAAGMPSWSADGREITVHIRRGILFTPHPAFGGKPRELNADDFIYSVKRIFDPAIHSPVVGLVSGMIAGLDERAAEAAQARRSFDYRSDIEGLRALDRYTIRIRLNRPDPAFVYLLASPNFSIVPHEAVEADGDEFARRPTGSGPYRVVAFQPGTRLALERNPLYRAVHWEDVATNSGASRNGVTSAGAPFRFPIGSNSSTSRSHLRVCSHWRRARSMCGR